MIDLIELYNLAGIYTDTTDSAVTEAIRKFLLWIGERQDKERQEKETNS